MKCVSPNLIFPHRSVEWCDRNEEKPMLVPCGKCLACLSNKRNDWSFRLEQEYKYSKGAHFVTLTYDQKHYPSDGCLDKRHVQLYLKRLRKRDGTNSIRYYAVGEYGSKSGRAHYHILLFNADEKNIRLAWCDSKGAPIGIVHVGTVTSASVAYVTKYIIQKPEHLEGRTKPFSLMSRKYGIGGKYLTDEMVNWHREGDKNYCIREGQKIRLPRFYREKVWYKPVDRERIASASLTQSLDAAIKEEKILRKKFGERWREKQAEMRLAVIQRIRKKVAYSQSF